MPGHLWLKLRIPARLAGMGGENVIGLEIR